MILGTDHEYNNHHLSIYLYYTTIDLSPPSRFIMLQFMTCIGT